MKEDEWFYMADAEVCGPCTFKGLQELVSQRKVQRKATVWTEGMERWKSADEIPGLVWPGEPPKHTLTLTRTVERRKPGVPPPPDEEAPDSFVVRTRAARGGKGPGTGVVSVGEWMLTLFLLYVPIVNIICLLVWAFGGGTKPDKANWARAAWIWILLGLVLYGLLIGGALALPSLLRALQGSP